MRFNDEGHSVLGPGRWYPSRKDCAGKFVDLICICISVFVPRPRDESDFLAYVANNK